MKFTFLKMILFGSLITHSILALQASIDIENLTVGNISAMTVNVTPEVEIPPLGSIAMITTSSFVPISGLFDCQILSPLSVQIESCQIQGSSGKLARIQLKQGVGAGVELVIKVKQFRNYGATKPSQSLKMSTSDEYNKEIETKWDITLPELIPAQIQQAQINPKNGEVGAKTSLIVSFQVSVSLPCPDCQFILKIPLSGQNQGETFFSQKNLKCFIDYSQIPSECDLAQDNTYGNYIKLDGISSRRVQAGTYLQFKLEGFKNPIDRKPVPGFSIYLLSLDGGLIEISEDLQIQAQLPAKISKASASINEGSTTISETSTLKISFDLPNPLSQGCILQVQIPEDFSQLYRKVTKVQISGMFGFPSSVPFQVNSGGVIEIRDACATYIENREQAVIKIYSVKNPSSVRDTGLFQIIVFDKERNSIATLAHTARVLVSKDQLTPSLFNSISILPSNGTVQESSSLSIELFPSKYLSQNAQIKLIFPFEFTLNHSCSVKSITLSVLTPYVQCRVNKTINAVYLSNLFYPFGYDPEADPKISFVINNVLERNPTSSTTEDQSLLIEVSTFEFSDQTGQNHNVDNGLFDISKSISPGELQIFSFLFNETVAYTSPTSMKMSLLIGHDLPRFTETSLKVIFPEDVQVDQQNSYVINRQGFTTSRPKLIFQTSQVLLIDGLRESKAGNSIEFIITRLRMPRYQGKVINDFTVQTVLTQTGGVIDQNKITMFVEKAQSFLFVDLANFSDKNREMTSLEFQIKIQDMPLIESDSFQIDLPLQMSIDTHPLCFIQDIKTDCEANFQRRRIEIGLDKFPHLNETDVISFSFKVQGVRNPATTKKIDGPQISFVNDRQQVLVTNDLYPLFVQTQKPGQLNAILRQSTTDPLTVSSYTLEFANLDQLEQIGLEIRFQDCMRFSSETAQLLKITDQFGIELQFTLEHNSTIFVPNIYPGLRLLILQGIINPSENCLKLGGIEVLSFVQGHRLELKDSIILLPSLSCDSQCLACRSTQKDYCTLCPAGFLLTTEGGCAKKCTEGTFFSIQANECQQCSSECETCDQEANRCTKCSQNDKYLHQARCVPANICLQNQSFFVENSSKVCQKCSLECSKCEENQDKCTQCWDNQLLHEGKCLEKCPFDFEISKDGDVNICSQIELLSHIRLILEDSLGIAATIILSILILIVKACCLQQMGIMVSLVIVTTSLEAIMCFIVLVFSLQEDYGQNVYGAMQLQYALFSVCGIIIIFNCIVTAKHLLSISKKTKLELDEANEEQVKSDNKLDSSTSSQAGERLSRCAFVCYLLSALISFHNTAWLNINGQLDLTRKRRLFENDFIRFYSRASKLWVILPGLAIKAIGLYFGIFGGGSLSQNDHFRLRALLLDMALVSTLSSFCINMALNFQLVDDDTEIEQNKNGEGSQTNKRSSKMTIQNSDLILNGKNSIALINLKLSQNDLSQIQKSRSRILQSRSVKSIKLLQNPNKKLDSLAAINLFSVEKSILMTKNRQKTRLSREVKQMDQSNSFAQFVITHKDLQVGKEVRKEKIPEGSSKNDDLSSEQSFGHFGSVIKKISQNVWQEQRRSSISSNPTTEMTLKSQLPKKEKLKMLSLWHGSKTSREQSKSAILKEINHQKFLAQIESKVDDFDLEKEQDNQPVRTTDIDASKFESNERFTGQKDEEIKKPKFEFKESLSGESATNEDLFAKARRSLSKYLE